MNSESKQCEDFCDRVLEAVRASVFLCQHGLRNPYGPAAMHLLETLENAYGELSGLPTRVSELRMELAYALAMKPKPQPLPPRGSCAAEAPKGGEAPPSQGSVDSLESIRERRLRKWLEGEGRE